MDSAMTMPSSAPNYSPISNPGSNEENPRVKFLCSFLGSIMPRPQDGKLRYVGGETRIVSVARDISYEELMTKMRELYEGAAVLKYQQPDEDLDALVSVVNDDDVINMMEEYDKVGSADGFTRLRIFLFSHPDQDGSLPFVDGDERDTERRYVDALNNSNDMNDFVRQQQPDSPVISGIDDVHGSEHFFNPMNIEGSLHTQRSSEPLSQYHLHQLTIPHGSGQQQQSVAQRYNEMEPSWNPAFVSPRHHGPYDSRQVGEYPSSPSGRYRMPFPDLPDKYLERMPEDYARQQMNHQHIYEHQPQYNENVVWLPNGTTTEKSGFPGNIFHGHGVPDGNSSCENCRANFHRYQTPVEQVNILNGLPPEYPQNRDALMQKADVKFHHCIFPSEQNIDHRSAYNETPSHERGWIVQHQMNVQGDDTRAHVSGAGRLNDHYIVDGSNSNFPPTQSNVTDGYHASLNFHDDVFRDQVVPMCVPPEDRGVGYMNMPYGYGGDPQYPPVAPRHMPGNALWRNVQNPLHVAPPPYEASVSLQQGNATMNPGYIRGIQEGSPRIHIGMDHQNPWHESSQKMLCIEGATGSDHLPAHVLQTNSTTVGHDNQHFPSLEHIQPHLGKINLVASPMQRSDSSSAFIHEQIVAPSHSSQNPQPRAVSVVNEAMMMERKIVPGEGNGHLVTDMGKVDVSHAEQNNTNDTYSKVAPPESLNSNGMNTPVQNGDDLKPAEETLEEARLSVNCLRFLPELIASVKRAALEVSEEETTTGIPESIGKKETANEPDSLNAHGEPELETESDQQSSEIEPTKAEAEAISRGLQTIKNDDLEEIRELGSGTYGAVYHGKWRGSDVAIKRIKASCFAGRPSERERLIADFWKEALILSSLHHPNVVSFYGIVRDGPDGTLATVTEFMVNGSLKQFLHKKDRTIDRRKRLIIAMDAAFGMEYLHGKNIVHFDLKCENLLVNMRDPQRPVCKIGDLGLSKVRHHTLVSGGVRGTLPWMAPELLSGKSNMVTEKIDVYSFGIVMWELLTGDEPYSDMHCASIIGGIVNNCLRPEIPTWCDPEWKALMSSCWDSDPAMRPSFSEISQKLRNMAAAMNVK